jgi:hypothetical protein
LLTRLALELLGSTEPERREFFFFLGSKDLYSFMKEKELKMDTNEWEEF